MKDVECTFLGTSAVVSVTKAAGMSSKSKWATLYLSDSTVVEGLVEEKMPYGIYIHINGDKSRLLLFPWSEIERVVYAK
jgi:hypothetical protein